MALKCISRGQEKPRWLLTEESELERQRDQVSFIQELLPFLALKQLVRPRDLHPSFIKYTTPAVCLNGVSTKTNTKKRGKQK